MVYILDWEWAGLTSVLGITDIIVLSFGLFIRREAGWESKQYTDVIGTASDTHVFVFMAIASKQVGEWLLAEHHQNQWMSLNIPLSA
jgi:hypothetical protein